MPTKHISVLIDNYDSFTYNIYQMMSLIIKDHPNHEMRIFRNDAVTVQELLNLNPCRLIISPGPGTPEMAGVSVAAVKAFAGRIPILGICLGHQVIAAAFGAEIIQAKAIVHGKVEPITIDGKGVLRNLPNPSQFTRYHSLAVDAATIPPEFEISARSQDGEIMGIRHRKHPIEGVQFHPESIGSEHGDRLLANFLHWRREPLNKPALLSKVISGKHLSIKETSNFMNELTDGALEETFIAGMLTALATKGYAPEELAGCVSVLIEKCRPVKLGITGILDTCGTGGDEKNTFNISSFAALIAASCGAVVAKHGNRSVSSKSGSTDFYAALGISTDLSPDGVAKSIQDTNFAYMAAPLYHSAMRHAAPVRQALGIKTIMNCLGPLANPAGASFQLIGVFDKTLLPTLATAAKILGIKRVLCVHSDDGLDEISPVAPTTLFMIDEHHVETSFRFDPTDLGLSDGTLDDLIGGDAEKNAQMAREMLNGGGSKTLRAAVCLNAGAALYVAGLAADIPEGYRQAIASLESGQVVATVNALQK